MFKLVSSSIRHWKLHGGIWNNSMQRMSTTSCGRRDICPTKKSTKYTGAVRCNFPSATTYNKKSERRTSNSQCRKAPVSLVAWHKHIITDAAALETASHALGTFCSHVFFSGNNGTPFSGKAW